MIERKTHSVYIMKQTLLEQAKQIRNHEIELKKLEIDLKCAEDSFALERKTKERYYKDLTQLEKRKDENRCGECTKLARSNSLTFNAFNQTLTIKKPSNQIQKLPNPNKYMMEDEEGQFMTNTNLSNSNLSSNNQLTTHRSNSSLANSELSATHLNEIRKRKTEFSDQEDYNKRLNILHQRNARFAPHLKTSYALEYQEIGGKNLNEKIKNSEKFEINFDEPTASDAKHSLANKRSFSLRFRK